MLFGATTDSSINVKSALALNSGLGIKCDSINAATTPALSIDVAIVLSVLIVASI